MWPPKPVRRSLVFLAPSLIGLALALAVPLASAESEAVCRTYAAAAVAAAAESSSRNCRLAGPRWHPEFVAHLAWCRQAPSEWVRNEDEFRLNLLRACRGEPRAVACKSYAFNASSSQVSNLSGRCGYSGRRWLDNDDEHLRWCLQAPEAAVTSEAGIRFALLGVCGRGQPFMRCDLYARQAVAQVGEAAARGCGFTGDRWTASYEGHLTWCIGHPDQAAIETREREGPLSQCRTSRPLPGGSPPTVQNDCNWSVRIENATCLNADGTGSSNPPGRFSATGCGGTQATALDRAKLGFGSRFGCLSEGDSPDAGCCTYRKEASLGCACQ